MRKGKKPCRTTRSVSTNGRSKKAELIDGLNPKDVKRLRAAIRQVWSWSYPRKLCIARATDAKGFGKCEKCRRRVPKLFADHKTVMGDVLSPDYILRMWTASTNLQALCKKCHDAKTRDEKRLQRLSEEASEYGFG